MSKEIHMDRKSFPRIKRETKAKIKCRERCSYTTMIGGVGIKSRNTSYKDIKISWLCFLRSEKRCIGVWWCLCYTCKYDMSCFIVTIPLRVSYVVVVNKQSNIIVKMKFYIWELFWWPLHKMLCFNNEFRASMTDFNTYLDEEAKKHRSSLNLTGV